MESSQLSLIRQAMAEPGFYPHPADSVEIRETHISLVFLAGEWVYKIKKPVFMGFLDFRELKDRRHYCERETLLNQRFCDGVYFGVVPIRMTAEGVLSLDGPGETIEYAVKMARLPDSDSLEAMLEANSATGHHMKELGGALAGFHGATESGPEIDRYGEPETILYNVEENFRQTEPHAKDFLDSERWEFIRQVSTDFPRRHEEVFNRRVQQGRIRDGHGDLRADHVYFHDGIQIIDCIEFNERFRYGDVIADVAFLYMDLEHRGRADLARAFVSSYVESANDPRVYSLLDFYACYRAMVTAKVRCLRADGMDPAEAGPVRREAARHLQQAYRYALRFARPILWVFCGLPASGKSKHAERLAASLNLPIYQSDRVRKECAGLEPGQQAVTGYGEGLYRPGMRGHVYTHMLALAQDQLKAGHTVILDATFSQRKWRDEARRLADDTGADFILVECACSEDETRHRLIKRETKSRLSDARLQHLPRLVAEFEPIEEIPAVHHVALDTQLPYDHNFFLLLSEAYARHWEQAQQRA